MRFETSQQMKLGQQMKLAPRMIQSMEILQMSLAELDERIEQELETNPTLEREETQADAGGDGEAPAMGPGAEAEGDGPEGEGAEGEDSGASPDRRDADPLAMESERLRTAQDADTGTLDVDEKHGEIDFERLEEFQQSNPDVAANEFPESDAREAPDDGTGRPAPERWDEGEAGPAPAWNRDGERDAKMDAMAAAPARSVSLLEQLQDQWALCDVEPALRPLGELLISFLDADGYLRTPLETVADRAPAMADGRRPTVAELEHALKAVQLLLEPAGMAARDARECLLLQVDALDADPVDTSSPTLRNTRTLIEGHLEDLLQNRLPRIAEKTHLTLEEIKASMLLMRRLSLAPARALVSEAPEPIVPDAIVEFDPERDRYIAYLNDRRTSSLRVNQEYALMARDKKVPKKDREFLKTNLSNAHWLIDAVNQRKHTLLRVLEVVVGAQREYFDFGPQALRPLPMTQVADQLGIHVATVSRAVAEKYIQTPRGVVALRRFFSGGTQTDSGENVSWDAIKAALQEVVTAEDKAKPFSDDALAEELKKRGIEIARRTVAKYRDQLGIPSARLRKAF